MAPPDTRDNEACLGPVLEPGDRVAAAYEVVRFLSSGGMGQVYEARNIWTERPVALKVLPLDQMTDDAARKRFIREAQLSARLTHPNIVRILDMGMDADGFLFMVHELVRGDTLEARIKRTGRLPVMAALKLMIPIVDALALAHEQGIVHRDVKPANILLAEKARDYIVPQLTDFGLAKPIRQGDDLAITGAGQRLGTPKYMSPEQLRADTPLDGRTDVWSVGATLYETLAGRLPFDARSVPELVLDILRSPILPPSTHARRIPPEVDALVMRALSRKRSDRFQTMRQMREALSEIVASMPSASERARTQAFTADDSDDTLSRAIDSSTRPTLESTTGTTGDTTRILRAVSLTRPLRVGLVATARALGQREVDEAFTKALGFRCDVLRYFNYAELVGAVAEREVEIAWLPPAAYVRARQSGVARLLLALERAGRAEFSSALLGRAGVVRGWDDLPGRRVAWVDPWSAAGYLVPRWMLQFRGLAPDQLFASQGFLGSHDVVLDALRAGTADVGATFCVRGDQGEIVEKPWADSDGFTVLAVSDPIPGDTICVTQDLSDELARLVSRELGRCKRTAPLLQMLGATRFVPADPARYEAFEVAMRADAAQTRRAVRE